MVLPFKNKIDSIVCQTQHCSGFQQENGHASDFFRVFPQKNKMFPQPLKNRGYFDASQAKGG